MVNNRIKLLVNTLANGKKSKFAKQIGVSSSLLGNIISGRNKPGYDTVEKIISRFVEINPTWLMTGVGEMFKYPNEYSENNTVSIASEPDTIMITETSVEENGNLKERLNSYLLHINVSGREFERLCDLKAGSYASIGDGIAARTLNKIIITCPELNSDWLITGLGEMLKRPKEYSENNTVSIASEPEAKYNEKEKSVSADSLIEKLIEENGKLIDSNKLTIETTHEAVKAYQDSNRMSETVITNNQKTIEENQKTIGRLLDILENKLGEKPE